MLALRNLCSGKQHKLDNQRRIGSPRQVSGLCQHVFIAVQIMILAWPIARRSAVSAASLVGAACALVSLITHRHHPTAVDICRIDDQEQWLRQQAAAPAHSQDPFWQSVGLMQAQLDGLYLGYDAAMDAAEAAGGAAAAAAAGERLSRDGILFLNSNGEL